MSQPLDPDVQYNIGPVPYHTHNGVDSPKLNTGSSANGSSSGTGVTTIPTATAVKVTPSNNFVNGITWDATNHRFTITASGQYLAIGNVTYGAPVSNKIYISYIYKNGAEVARNEQTGVVQPFSLPISIILNLVAGDYIELYTSHVAGADQSISSTASLTFLSIAKV